VIVVGRSFNESNFQGIAQRVASALRWMAEEAICSKIQHIQTELTQNRPFITTANP